MAEKKAPMGGLLERRRGWPFAFPDVFDWLESGVPGLLGTVGLHGIRIEEDMTDDAYVVRAELPGIDPDRDVEITVHGGVLTLRAERSEREEGAKHSEFRYGAFARALRLPEGARAEDATADYQNGILAITVPCAEADKAAKTITIRHKS
jgi:HSP20 family protein